MSKNQFFAAAFSLTFVAGPRAQSEASALGDVSELPIASASSLPLAGSVLVIKRIDTGIYVTRYMLERESDGAQMELEVAGRGVKQAAVRVGATVTAKAHSTGILLVAGQEEIAFVPNALGRALLQDDRVTL
jgi:hypothetical protein